MAIDKEVGAFRSAAAEDVEGDKERAMRSYYNNDKISLFRKICLTIGFSERPASEEELQGTQMGLTEVIGLNEVMSKGCSLKQVEDLGLDSRPLGLHSVDWAGLGSIPTQFKVLEDSLGSISASSKQAQDQTINQSKRPSSGKCGGRQFTLKVLRRRKSAMTKGRIS
ncbi:hypothetical protein Ancab_013248 [Ancistrocladus abbreviatus]